MSTSTTERIRISNRPATRRIWMAGGAAAAALVALYAVLPVAGVHFPVAYPTVDTLYRPATAALDMLGVTSILVLVAASTVVAILRGLHFGIAAVLVSCLGANLTGLGVRQWSSGVLLESAAANGPVIAIGSVVAAGAVVSSAALRPAVLGLGSVLVLAIGLAATITARSSVIGVAGALLVVGLWWAVAALIMQHSPVAAARAATDE